MGYKTSGAKVKVMLVKGSTEIRLLANREGLRYLCEVCNDLLGEEYVPDKPPHAHIEPALNTAEAGSIPKQPCDEPWHPGCRARW